MLFSHAKMEKERLSRLEFDDDDKHEDPLSIAFLMSRNQPLIDFLLHRSSLAKVGWLLLLLLLLLLKRSCFSTCVTRHLLLE